MKVKNLFRVLPPLFLTVTLFAVASESARAQESAPSAAPRRAQKYDEFGRLGHCDLTARLDNFAIELQNNPRAKGFVVSYDARGKRRGLNLKVSRFYLVNLRGIEPGRVVAIEGGSRESDEAVTELWVVPEGAEPPVEPPAEDKYAAAEFSGKFDSYFTDGRIYKYMVEMGYTDSEIAYAEFAEKLKAQPDSVGYLVVRAPENALAGDWRRVGRRDEQILSKDYGVEAARLKTLNGGQTEGERTEVEFWILPKSAPPPASLTEELTRTPKAAVVVNRFDSYGSLEKGAERWMVGNLAEVLRDNPRATACLVARDEAVYEAEGGEEYVAEEESEAAAEGPPAEVKDAEGEEAEGEEADGVDFGSTLDLAERWKELLVKEHGIEARRVVVLEGRPMPWSNGRLTAWLVPEKAALPDPLARDEDEPEEEEAEAQASEGRGVKDGKKEATPPRY